MEYPPYLSDNSQELPDDPAPLAVAPVAEPAVAPPDTAPPAKEPASAGRTPAGLKWFIIITVSSSSPVSALQPIILHRTIYGV